MAEKDAQVMVEEELEEVDLGSGSQESRGMVVTRRRGVLTIVPIKDCSGKQHFEKKMKFAREPLTFDDEDLEGTI